MIRRWLICCLCLLPLPLCGLGWIWGSATGKCNGDAASFSRPEKGT